MPPRIGSVVALGATLVLGCAQPDPTGPGDEPVPGFSIVDGAHNAGNPHFYFLPPLVSNPNASGQFDPAGNPRIEICEWGVVSCIGAPIAVFTMTTGPGGEVISLDEEGERYKANWHSKDFDLDAAKTYRIQVLVGSQELGHADVDVVNSGNELKNVNTGEYIALKDGRTLPIGFRIEVGAVHPTREVAFISDRDGNSEIYAMNADGTDQTRLTNDPATDAFASWSPDRSQLAFASTRSGNYDIWVMNADGSGLIQLTTAAGLDYLPAWSPDGSTIAFTSNRDGNQDIWVMNSDGTGQVNLTSTGSLDYGATWSPDGTKLAFTSDRAGSQDIWSMSADGANPAQLTTDPSIDYTPAWSPDGSRIAFSSERDGGVEEVYVMNADGSSQIRLTNSPTEDFAPAWSPDGSMILFSSNRFGNYNFFLVPATGGATSQLTFAAGDNYYPVWR